MLNLEKQFENILQRNREIEKNLSNQKDFNSENLIKLNKEYADLKPIVDTIHNFNKLKKDINDLNILTNDKDNSIKEMAEIELKNAKKKIKTFIRVGAVSGLSSIFIGATGPLIAPFFLKGKLIKEEIIANKAVCQAISHIGKIPIFIIFFQFNYITEIEC